MSVQSPDGLPAQVTPERTFVRYGHDTVPGKTQALENCGESSRFVEEKRDAVNWRKTNDYTSLPVCTPSPEYANSKFKWRESKILISVCCAGDDVTGRGGHKNGSGGKLNPTGVWRP